MTTALSLLVLEYAAIRPVFRRRPILTEDLAYWSFLCFVAYLAVPALLTRFVLKERLRDFGLTFRGFGTHLPLYALLFLLVLPLVYLASRDPSFRHTYPFAAEARNGFTDLLKWELIYGLQFLSLEFFFRGFLIFGLEKRFGANAIFVMAVPYCMIHFHKPWPEALGAIGAGLILGALALRTRPVLGGVLIHWAVAISMDVLAILGSGGFR